MDYLKTVIPPQLVAERGSNLVVINPGSANIRIGLATQVAPLSIPHCIARYTNQIPKFRVQDQILNSQVTTAQHMEREKAYDIVASLLKIPFLDEEVANNSLPRKIGRVDGYNPQSGRSVAFPWANVYEQDTNFSLALGTSKNEGTSGKSTEKHVGTSAEEISSGDRKFRGHIFGEEALRISPTEPYCLGRPIRRGHFNISQHYPLQQVLEDLHAIWDWMLIEKLHIPHSERNMYSAILVLPETFDNRASVVKAVMKYGKKPFVLDENKRDTYKHPLGSHEPSVLTTFEGELKQLMVVGLSSEHGYARSLARYAADLGPFVWRIASKKIESVLPTGFEFGPGWVGEKSIEKHKVSNNPVLDNHISRFQPATSSSRDAAWSREDMLENVGVLNSKNELTTLNSSVGGMKSVPSVPIQQKPMIHPDMNGFSGGFGYNSSSQLGMVRTVAPTGKFGLEHPAVPSQMFGVVPSSNSAFILNKAMLSENSSGLLQSGISPAVGSSSDTRALSNVGFAGKSSWQGFLPYHQQGTVPFPPDLNVGFLAPGSHTSSVPIGSPRQPDLALQL